jgi:hypothetical protein
MNYWRQTHGIYTDKETINVPQIFQNILSMLTITHVTIVHKYAVVSEEFIVAYNLFKY